MAAAIAAADAAGLAAPAAIRGAGAAFRWAARPSRIGPDEVVVTQTPLAGWAVASDGGETVALEVTITPELRREGLAREFVRLVQEARKATAWRSPTASHCAGRPPTRNSPRL